jgi:hypothetical protein
LRTPVEIKEALRRFQKDYPDPSKVCFIMMKFGRTKAHDRIVTTIKKTLASYGITGIRSDDKQYHDDLFYNIQVYLYCCGFGVAVFERLETDQFNPNVSLEVGHMLALRKPVCLLKDETLKTLHADLLGKIYKKFDPQDPAGTIHLELSHWLRDMGFVATSADGSISLAEETESRTIRVVSDYLRSAGYASTQGHEFVFIDKPVAEFDVDFKKGIAKIRSLSVEVSIAAKSEGISKMSVFAWYDIEPEIPGHKCRVMLDEITLERDLGSGLDDTVKAIERNLEKGLDKVLGDFISQFSARITAQLAKTPP